MDNLTDRFKKSVERVMTEKGMNQRDLAKALQVAPPGLSRLLADQTSPRLDTVERIAHALGQEPWQLLRPDEPAKPTQAGIPHLSKFIDELEKLPQGDAIQVLKAAWKVLEVKLGRELPNPFELPEQGAREKKR